METFLFNQKYQKVIILASTAGPHLCPPHLQPGCPWGSIAGFITLHKSASDTLLVDSQSDMFYQWPVPRKHKWFSRLFWLSGEDVVLLLPTPLLFPRRDHFLKLSLTFLQLQAKWEILMRWAHHPLNEEQELPLTMWRSVTPVLRPGRSCKRCVVICEHLRSWG